jgi:hypothetical protein
MLREAQGVVAERENRNLVSPRHLKEWKAEATFKSTTTIPERIQIDGHVKGGDRGTRAKQESFLRRKGLPQANLEDLAAAFVAFYVATGKDLFEGRYVCAVGGALNLNRDGLSVDGIVGDYSARVMLPLPRACARN